MTRLKLNLPGTKRLFIILVLSVIVSCNDHSASESNAGNNKRTEADSIVQASITDPLFFIPGQLCQHLRRIFRDSHGNLWFGTNVYGLMRYDGRRLEYFNRTTGNDFGRITGIAEDSEGIVWIGCYKGLFSYDGNTFTRYSEKDGLLNNEIWSFLIDRSGTFWIGTNAGVSRFDGKDFTNFPVPKAVVKDTNTIYSYDRIVGIAEDKTGNIWFGTDGFGVCRYNGKTFSHYTTADGLAGNTISELMTDSDGNLWIGTYFGGVSMFDGKQFHNFTQEGLISGTEIAGLFEDRPGNIWFAAENHGVYRFNGETFTHFGKNAGLETNGILSIYQDDEDRFWFGGWGGLFRFDGETFTSVTRDGPWD